MIAPRDPTAPDTSDLLIVTVDAPDPDVAPRWRGGRRLARGAGGGRSEGRLQSIGWLAGNLARDQVGAVVAGLPARAPVSVASAEAEPARAPRRRRGPGASRPVTNPCRRRERRARTAGAPGGVVSTGALGAAAAARLRMGVDARAERGLVQGEAPKKGSGRVRVSGLSFSGAFVERPGSSAGRWDA